WGGEEFVVAAPGLDEVAGMELGRRMAQALRDTRLVVNERRVPITGSIGVAIRERDDTPDSLVDRADHAMYAAKATGRDRVCTVDDSISRPAEPEIAEVEV
ncbi:MAG: GGDEF domain-containing protein, partial [Myxococcales bacterium]|nr:GGDEF domain-containing protein [Myxococcales bacterium]